MMSSWHDFVPAIGATKGSERRRHVHTAKTHDTDKDTGLTAQTHTLHSPPTTTPSPPAHTQNHPASPLAHTQTHTSNIASDAAHRFRWCTAVCFSRLAKQAVCSLLYRTPRLQHSARHFSRNGAPFFQNVAANACQALAPRETSRPRRQLTRKSRLHQQSFAAT